MPLLVPTSVPLLGVQELQSWSGSAAARIIALVSGTVGVEVPQGLAHAAVLVPSGGLPLPPLLVMKVTGSPQPVEEAGSKPQLLRARGNRQDSGGTVRGGLETAVDSAETARVFSPNSRRNDVGIWVAYWHRTALTRVPSRDGVKVARSQIPRTMSPLVPFPEFRPKLMVPTR